MGFDTAESKIENAAQAVLLLKNELATAILDAIKEQNISLVKAEEITGKKSSNLARLLNFKFENKHKVDLLYDILLKLDDSYLLVLRPEVETIWKNGASAIDDFKLILASAVSLEMDRRGLSLREAAKFIGMTGHTGLNLIKNGSIEGAKLDSIYNILLRLNPIYKITLKRKKGS
ncbi:MAG: hypothetical protein EOP04_02860 [Proteobacteria bacterium]|nr:MAG: hypothetical protein EOP04_02860 [Pseudomonadota bacterium]